MSFHVEWRYAEGHPWSPISGLAVFNTLHAAQERLALYIAEIKSMARNAHQLPMLHEYRFVERGVNSNRTTWERVVGKVVTKDPTEDVQPSRRPTAWERVMGDE